MGFWIPFLVAASLFTGAASYVAAKKAQKAAKRPNDDQRGVLVNKESNIEQIPVIYGERRVGGVRVFVSTDGTTSTGAYTWKSGYDADTEAYAEFENSPTNEYLYIALVLAEGEVESITDLIIDDVPITDSKFSGLIDYDVYLGSDAQTMPTTALLRGVNEFWTADHRLRGVAFLGLRFKWDEEAFAGVPDVTALVKGRKLYDPRTATTAWSDNPALCIRDYLTNTRYGKGLATSAVDDTAIGVAATACDESVTEYSGGVTGKLFTCNTVLDTSKTLFDNLNILLLGCRGFLPYSQGEYRLKIDGSGSSQFAFTTDHIIGGISIQGESKSDKYNRVTVKFPNPDANWQPDTAIWPPAGSTEETAYLAADGGVLLQEEIELDTITNYYQARDLARVLLLRSRNGITCAIKVTSEALQLEIADVITVTHPTPDWTAKPFQIMGMQLNDDGTVDIALLEYDSTIYTWEVGTIQQTYPDTSLADPFTVGAVSNIVITETTTLGVDGTVIPSGLITWTAPYDKLVNSFEIQYKLASQADSFFESIITGLARYEFFNAVVGVTVTLRIRSINSLGSKSAWTITTYTVTGDVAAPDAPTALSVSQGMLNIRLDWTNPTATDYKATDLYRHTANNSALASKIASISGESFVDQNIAADTTYYYWAKAVDYSGNYSGFSAVASTNAIEVTASGVVDGTIDVASFAAGLEPVSLVTSVPTVKATETIYNTTDSLLYRWDGSAYVSVQGATDFSELNGTVATAQIADAAVIAAKLGSAAVEAGKIASNAVTTDKIASLAVNADKIASNAITTAKIAADAVTSAELADNAATEAAIATNAITATKISDGAIETAKLAAGAVTAAKITAGTITASEIASSTIVAGNIAAGTITASEIAGNTITATQIAAGTITSAEILTGTITATQIAANAITASEIAANTITASQIAAGAISATEIASGAVTTAKLSALSITSDKIASNAITTAKISAGAVTAATIATGTITASKIASNTITAGEIAAGAITASEIAANAISVEKLISNTSKTYGSFEFEMGTSTTIYGFTGAGIFTTTATDGFGVGGFANAADSVGIAGQNKYNGSNSYGGYFANSTGGLFDYNRSESGLCNNAHAAVFAKNTSSVTQINNTSICNATYAVQTTGDLYVDGDITATGTITPFTGMHDGLLADAVFPDIGDILIDSQLLIKRNVANTLFLMDISSVSNTAAIGIYAGTRPATYVPVAAQSPYVQKPLYEDNLPTIDPLYAPDFVGRKTIISNSLGEGLVNVCNEGGDIAAGDLIVTSSVPGKGKKQADDILRGYTVAKAREAVTFSGSEIKQIACIYLCG